MRHAICQTRRMYCLRKSPEIVSTLVPVSMPYAPWSPVQTILNGPIQFSTPLFQKCSVEYQDIVADVELFRPNFAIVDSSHPLIRHVMIVPVRRIGCAIHSGVMIASWASSYRCRFIARSVAVRPTNPKSASLGVRCIVLTVLELTAYIADERKVSQRFVLPSSKSLRIRLTRIPLLFSSCPWVCGWYFDPVRWTILRARHVSSNLPRNAGSPSVITIAGRPNRKTNCSTRKRDVDSESLCVIAFASNHFENPVSYSDDMSIARLRLRERFN
jgi:hypothetical protein